MLNFKKIFLFSCFVVVTTSAQASLELGVINDFQSNTVEEWKHEVSDSPTKPSLLADEGPDGDGDFALRISGNGQLFAPGSRLQAINQFVPWAGAADKDVEKVEMDIKRVELDIDPNLGIQDFPGDLQIRIAIGNSGTWFASQTGYTLSESNRGNWEHAVFLFSDLMSVQGSDSLESVLGDITEVRILHSALPNFEGDNLAAAFAVDNIATVPVPGAVWLFATAVGFLRLHYRSRKIV